MKDTAGNARASLLYCRCGCGREAVVLASGEDIDGRRYEDEPMCQAAADYVSEAAALFEKPFSTRPVPQRVTVDLVHALTGADIDGLRRLPGYDRETDTLPFDPGAILADPKPGPPQPPLGTDQRHG